MFGDEDIEKSPEEKEGYDPKPTPSTDEEKRDAARSNVVKETRKATDELKEDVQGNDDDDD